MSHFGTSPVTRRLAQLSTISENARSSNICLATILSSMPLEKDFSMVADSTVSSSPAADASVQIKRAARTYGKRRNEFLEGPTDSTSQLTLRAGTIHNTAPPGLQETVPPSSPAKSMTSAIDEFSHGEACNAFQEPVFECGSGHIQVAQDRGAHLEQGGHSPKVKCDWRKRLDDLEDNNAAEATTNSSGRTQVKQDGGAHLEQDGHSTKFKYEWRKRLEEIDEGSDMEDNDASAEAPRNKAPKVSFLFGNARLLQEAKGDTKQLDSAMTEPTPLPSVANDVFSCPLPSPPGPGLSFALSSPPATTQRSRRRRRILVQSDSEDEHLKDSSSTAPSTSGRASLESPKSRTSSTQPTSDEELPSKVSVEQKRANGTGPVHLSALEVADLTSHVGNKGRRDGKGKSKVIET